MTQDAMKTHKLAERTSRNIVSQFLAFGNKWHLWHGQTMLRAFILTSIVFSSSVATASSLCERLLKNDASLGQPGATCTVSSLLDGTEQSTCYWSYVYRSDEVHTRVEELRVGIEECLGSKSALPADQTVNHPDSFALYRYEGQGLRVSLSLKDKAALQQSLIFLSLSASP